VAFYSLQQGAGADVEAARRQGFDVEDHTAEFSTFDDTAAFVDGLDVVITVCTSIAHLSGALGKPTWILLDRNPHWVWGLARADSPWYPTATLYRQSRFADWSGPLKAVTRDLKALAKSR
jgi:ADP-heptose:LPS heptosyltransferase